MKKLLKNLTKLANRLDSAGLTKEADRIDRIIKMAVEEWEYHGYTSPEEYERVRKMRRPELYERPEEGKEEEVVEREPEQDTKQVHKTTVTTEVAEMLKDLIKPSIGGINKVERHKSYIKIYTKYHVPLYTLNHFNFNKVNDVHYIKKIDPFYVEYMIMYTSEKVIVVSGRSAKNIDELEEELGDILGK